MSAFISAIGGIITPSLVLGIESTREASSVVHPIIGRADPDVTLRPSALRTGTLHLGFAGTGSETASADAEALLSTPAVFTLSNDERPSLGFSFIVSGPVSRQLDDVTRDAWIIEIGYTEVAT